MPLMVVPLLVAGCTPDQTTPPTDTSTTTSGLRPTPPAVTTVLNPPYQEGPNVPGLLPEGVTFLQLSSEPEDPSYMVRWPQLPGATAPNERLTQTSEKQLTAFTGDEAAPAGGGELRVTGQVVAWSDAVAAVRTTSLVPEGAKGAFNHALYGARDGSWVTSSLDLIDAASERTSSGGRRRGPPADPRRHVQRLPGHAGARPDRPRHDQHRGRVRHDRLRPSSPR